LNFELFIAKKIRSGGVTGKKLAGPVIKVATLGVILGMVVMILSLAIGFGFKKEIREKIVGFGSHIQVMSYDYNESFETNPINFDPAFIEVLDSIPGVENVQVFATKPGIIKTKDALQGIVLKGVDHQYNWSFIDGVLQKGEVLNLNDSVKSNGILISEDLASMLQLELGDPVRMYFFQNSILARKFTVTGIYNSNFPEFDKTFAYVDIRHVQKLNGWEQNEVSGYEIGIEDFNRLDELTREVYFQASSRIEDDGSMMRTRSIKQVQPQIFGWLNLLDMNVLVIIVLIVLVAGINMVSGLLILILERTNMIGVLKALGAQDKSLQKVFLYLSTFILGKGLLIGNLFGLGICLLQKYTHFVSLDPVDYYLEYVPIHINLWHVLVLNLSVVALTMLMMLAPSFLVARISPVKAIRFD